MSRRAKASSSWARASTTEQRTDRSMAAHAIPPEAASSSLRLYRRRRGSGGCAVARRLIDGSDASVLLDRSRTLRASALPKSTIPAAWVPLGRSRYDWGYDYAPTPRVNNRVIGIPRGKVLGGSSSINAMMWYRGHPTDYDAWEAAGAKGWSFKDVLPVSSSVRKTGKAAHRTCAVQAARCASSEARHCIRSPRRCSTASGRTRHSRHRRSRTARPTKVLPSSNFNISGGKRLEFGERLSRAGARQRAADGGDQFARDPPRHRKRPLRFRYAIWSTAVRTRLEATTGEIVLALGAIDTPRLLMLSGIGDPAELKRLGIDVRAALRRRRPQSAGSSAGAGLSSFAPGSRLGRRSTMAAASMMNWKSSAHLPQADLHAFPVQGNSAEAAIRRTSMIFQVTSFRSAAGLMRSKQRRLSEAAEPGAGRRGSRSSPIFSLNRVISTPSSTSVGDDDGARGNVPPMPTGSADIAAPRGDARPSRTSIDLHPQRLLDLFPCLRHLPRWATRICPWSTSRLRVHGHRRAAIADASVIPIIPTCNTHAPVTMIGERAADFMLNCGGT